MLFHFKLLGVGGGYLGVDIFFVLSGYLISGMLRRKSHLHWKEALSSFYLRRFWRISPALFFTITATLAIGWFVYLPEDYARLGISSAFSAIFISNFFFAEEAGYFDTASAFKPLLHTWSLAVEIQFYLLWPILFLFANRLSERVQGWLLWLLVIVSFILALVFSFTDPAVSFYAMPFRLWEFSFGALCALPAANTFAKKCGIFREPIRLTALGVLLACTYFYHDLLLWPAPFAALPVIAATLLIATEENGEAVSSSNFTSAILGWWPIVWLGEISYSLYLVHWPIVTINNMISWPGSSTTVRAVLLLLCIPLAWLLYRFIEQPFRYSWANWSLGKQILMCFTSLAVIIFAGQAIHSQNGFVARYSPELEAQLNGEFSLLYPPQRQDCFSDCPIPITENGGRKIFLWGDSHAAHFHQAVQLLSENKGYKLVVSTNGGCPPFPGIKRVNSRVAVDRKCPKRNSAALKTILNDSQIETVILAARWAVYSTTIRYGQEASGNIFLVETNFAAVSKENSKTLFRKGLSGVVNSLVKNGKKVIIFDQVPEFSFDSKRCWVMKLTNGAGSQKCTLPAITYETRLRQFRKIAIELAAINEAVSFYKFGSAFCRANKCTPLINGELAYADNNHLFKGAAYQILKAKPLFR